MHIGEQALGCITDVSTELQTRSKEGLYLHRIHIGEQALGCITDVSTELQTRSKKGLYLH